MKREMINSHGDGGGMQGGKSEERKRIKRAAVEEEEEEKKEDVEEGEKWVEEWPWLNEEVVVDEQMSWGYFTLPIWGVEFMAESYVDLFSDVVWDDDVWNLMSIHEIPATNPLTFF